MPILVQICIAVATLALVAVAVALIRVLGQARATAEQVERTMAHLDTTLPQLNQAIEDAHDVFSTMGRVGQRVDRLAAQFESVGSRAAHVSSQLVDEVLVPAGRAAAIARGLRVGVSTLVGALTRTRKHHEPTRLEGGNHHE